MKKIVLAFIAIISSLVATAQVEHSIVIDQSSFRPEQLDALTGANIDPIGDDLSRKPCARIKIKFDNMSRAEVDALAVKFQSNTDIARQEVAPYFDNVLILEVSAKPNTRFYVKHPDYGESNEVTVNLEPYKVYLMEAHLNYTYHIVIKSNVADAEVYIDDRFKGRTNSELELTVKDITPGEHTLKLKYGGAQPEKKITVSSNSISFRQNVDTSAAAPQHIVFKLSPADALLEIEGSSDYGDYEGTVRKKLMAGNYDYTVSAPNYHTYKGTISVRNDKVTEIVNLQPAFGYLNIDGDNLNDAVVYIDDKQVGKMPIGQQQLPSGEHKITIRKPRYKNFASSFTINDLKTVTLTPTLEPNFTSVTLSGANDIDIYLNNEFVSRGSYMTTLDFGTHIVEGRKAGHRSSPKIFEINNATPIVIDITEPTPIYGHLDINSNTTDAEIYLDGNKTGKLTPDMLRNLIIGEHTVTITKPHFKPESRKVTIVENQITEITINMTSDGTLPMPKPTPVVKPTPAPKPAKEPKQPKVKEPKTTAKKQKYPAQKGYYSTVALGMQFGGGFIPSLHYIGGYRAGNALFVGAGVGFGFAASDKSALKGEKLIIDDYKNNEGDMLPMSKIAIPIYINTRVYMSKGGCKPYFALSAGANICPKNSLDIYAKVDNVVTKTNTISYGNTSLFAEPALGLDFRIKGKSSISLQVGANIHSRAHYNKVSTAQGSVVKKGSFAINTTIGINF